MKIELTAQNGRHLLSIGLVVFAMTVFRFVPSTPDLSVRQGQVFGEISLQKAKAAAERAQAQTDVVRDQAAQQLAKDAADLKKMEEEKTALDKQAALLPKPSSSAIAPKAPFALPPAAQLPAAASMPAVKKQPVVSKPATSVNALYKRHDVQPGEKTGGVNDTYGSQQEQADESKLDAWAQKLSTQKSGN